MLILSHRGLWTSGPDKNSVSAFERSRAQGFGIETDIRDACGDIVISHDPPSGSEPELGKLVSLFQGTGLTLAINIKADGLAGALADALAETDITWYCFDMSGPEMIRYVDAGLPVYTRQSEVEPHPILYDNAVGIWLDAFGNRWYEESVIEDHVRNGKHVTLVSAELHGRPHLTDWAWLSASGISSLPGVTLCTDFPIDARDFFGCHS